MKSYSQLAKLIATTNSSQAFRIKGYEGLERLNTNNLSAPSFSAIVQNNSPEAVYSIRDYCFVLLLK